MKLRLSQGDLAERFNVCEDTVTGWENGRSLPQIQFYPKIIEFLGYSPFALDNESIGGQIYRYRTENGLSRKKLATVLGFDTDTLKSWEENITEPKLPAKMKLVSMGIIK